MVRKTTPSDNPSTPSDPIADILNRIRALTPEDRERLFRTLNDWPPEQMAGLRLIGHQAFEDLVDRAEGWLNDLINVCDQLRTIKRTHQQKRRPSKHTLDALKKIQKWRSEKASWAVIDRRLGFKSGGARQIYKDAEKRGWE